MSFADHFAKATGVSAGGRVKRSVMLDADLDAAVEQIAQRERIAVGSIIRRFVVKGLRAEHELEAA